MREISRTELRSYRDYFVSVCDREKEREGGGWLSVSLWSILYKGSA